MINNMRVNRFASRRTDETIRHPAMTHILPRAPIKRTHVLSNQLGASGGSVGVMLISPHPPSGKTFPSLLSSQIKSRGGKSSYVG